MPTVIYVTSKIDNKEYCKTNGQFTKHLRNNNLTYQEYYEKYVSKASPLCSCGNSLTFYQKNHSYAKSCGNPKCVGKNVSVTKQNWTEEEREIDSKNKRISANKRTAEEVKTIVNKAKETFKKKYGVEWVTQTPNFKDKSKETKLERYGNEYYANSAQTSKAWQAKTIDEIEVIVNKRKSTCLERFGVENAFLKPEVKANSAKSNSLGKEFILPSGNVIHIRGYEGIAIKKLLEIYDETELLVDNRLVSYYLPSFVYVDNRRHTMKYYPDIFIPTENKIIEVKSKWWWDGNGDTRYESRLINNLRKKDSVLSQNFNYEVWLFDNKEKYEILSWMN